MDFKDLNLVELDKNLTEEERNEWNAIYASYQSSSIVTGNVVGVDMHTFHIVPDGRKRPQPKTMRCLIVIKYLVKVIIPETEIFDIDIGTGYHVLHSMCGANIEYVITHIDREEGFAIASRKTALTRTRNSPIHSRIKEGTIVEAKVLSVGRGLCTISYNGYDMIVPQREVSYSSVPDLRDVMRPGELKKALVKEFNREEGILKLSIKDAMPHPFDGIETRHPLKSTRIATITGKYKGGVFCRLHDKVTTVLCSYLSMEYDGNYKIGDSVEIVINKYNYDRKIVYGKILRKLNIEL